MEGVLSGVALLEWALFLVVDLFGLSFHLSYCSFGVVHYQEALDLAERQAYSYYYHALRVEYLSFHMDWWEGVLSV